MGQDQGTHSSRGKKHFLDCGWGRLIFANSFRDHEGLVEMLRQEVTGRRDIACYLKDPQVALSLAPQELFLDPSHHLRLELESFECNAEYAGDFIIRSIRNERDITEANRIYQIHNMVDIPTEFALDHRDSKKLLMMVVENPLTGKIRGVVQGVDHHEVFDDPEQGASLWSLAVDPHAENPGIGEGLVRHLAGHFKRLGRRYLDLSVMHNNHQALALYRKLGFKRVSFFFMKKKNPINEKLYIGPPPETQMNPYARIIINEARRRGIAVDIIDEKSGYFSLTFGGRTIVCRESLSDLTSSVAMSICSDKAVTRRLLVRHGLPMPDQQEAGTEEENRWFLNHHPRVVVKPAVGEQGAGITMDPGNLEALEKAIQRARRVCETVLLEELVEGEDLRILVINFRVVAAAVRRPAQIIGDGRSTVRELTIKQSRRRAAATGNESRIPLDEETERCIRLAGYTLDSIPDADTLIQVRKTANLHTGGTLTDVTDYIHPALVDAAVTAAKVINIPVVGFDFMVPDYRQPRFKIIEANERPGLANHEPQPTAERFVDLLFPQTRIAPVLEMASSYST